MRIPDEFVNCVVFICVKISAGNNTGKYQSFGTGFIVTMDRQEDEFGYLITARHIVDDAYRVGHEKLYARMNKRNGEIEYVDLGLIEKWIKPDNEGIDIALIPFLPDFEEFKCTTLSHNMLVTPAKISQRNIGQGDDLYITGLLTLRRGRSRNIPIVRTGIISAMPVEPIYDKKSGEFFNAYLAEMRSIGGLSGSPVFVYLNKHRVYSAGLEEEHDYIFHLLGMIRGHWNLERELDDDCELTEDATLGFSKGENLNIGIAVITTGQDILQLLYHPKLVKIRDEKMKTT